MTNYMSIVAQLICLNTGYLEVEYSKFLSGSVAGFVVISLPQSLSPHKSRKLFNARLAKIYNNFLLFADLFGVFACFAASILGHILYIIWPIYICI